MQKLIHGHLIPGPEAADLRTGFQIQILLGNGHYIIHISIFQRQHGSHDLGDTGWIYLLKCLFGIKHLPVIQIQKKPFLVLSKGNPIHRNIRNHHTKLLGKAIRPQAVCPCNSAGELPGGHIRLIQLAKQRSVS